MNVICWYCGKPLTLDTDFNYDEVYGHREGVVSILSCTNCGATVQISKRENEESHLFSGVYFCGENKRTSPGDDDN